MAAGVPKRREGGVATIVYNLGREMENRGHRVTYVFLDDLVPPNSVSPRFSELIFSSRLLCAIDFEESLREGDVPPLARLYPDPTPESNHNLKFDRKLSQQTQLKFSRDL